MATERTVVEVGVVATGGGEPDKIAQGIENIRNTAVNAIRDQIKALENLYQTTPRREGVDPGAPAREVLERMRELGRRSRLTAEDVQSANDLIAQSIREVLRASGEGVDLPAPVQTEATLKQVPGLHEAYETFGFLLEEQARVGEQAIFDLVHALQDLQRAFGDVDLSLQIPIGEHLEAIENNIRSTSESVGIGREAWKNYGKELWDALQPSALMRKELKEIEFRSKLMEGVLKGKAESLAKFGDKVEGLGSEYVVLEGITQRVQSAINLLHKEVKTAELVFRGAKEGAGEIASGFSRLTGKAAGAKGGISKIIGMLGKMNPKLLLVTGSVLGLRLGFKALGEGIRITKQVIEGAGNIIRRFIGFLRNLIQTLADVVRSVYNTMQSILEFARNVGERAVNAVRSLIQGLGRLIPSFRGSSEAADRSNRTFYLTTRRSYEAARAVDYFSSVAAGFSTGMSVARGNLTAFALSAHWMRRTIIPVMMTVTALTIVVAGLSNAFKKLTERAIEFGARAQDVQRHFGSLAASMEEGTQYWMASAHWAIKYGRSLEDTRDSLVEFWQAGLDTNEMLGAAQALASAWNMELSQASNILVRAVGDTEGAVDSLRDYGIVMDEAVNHTDRLTRAQEISTAVMEQFGEAAEQYVQSLTGALQRASSAFEYFWEILTEPIAAQVLAPTINAFVNFFSTIIALTAALWKSEAAQSYFNRTLSIATDLVRRFRPEITILGNIVRLVVTAAFWGLQAALRGVVRAMEQLLTWVRGLFNWLSALIRPIKPLADAFRALSQSWKEVAFTDLLQQAKQFLLDFPITMFGIETTLREVIGVFWNTLKENFWSYMAGWAVSIGGQLLAHLAGIKKLSIRGIVGALVTVLLRWLGDSVKDFLIGAHPQLEDMFTNMFDVATWMSIIGATFFGPRGALVFYLAGLLAGFLDHTFELGINEFVQTTLERVGNYLRSRFQVFWENLFVWEDDQIVAINFDQAFRALADQLIDDWNTIFLPAIQDFLGMEGEGPWKISDYIGHAFITAFRGATWVAGVFIKLYELIKQGWEEHVVPAWRDYIRPELENLWETYLRPPLENLYNQFKAYWDAFWGVLLGREMETDIEWDVRFWGDDWAPDISSPIQDMENLFERSPILRTIKDLTESIQELIPDQDQLNRFSEFAGTLGRIARIVGTCATAVWDLARGTWHFVGAIRELARIFGLVTDPFGELDESSGSVAGSLFGINLTAAEIVTSGIAGYISFWAGVSETLHRWTRRTRERLEELRDGIKEFIDTKIDEFIEGVKGEWQELVEALQLVDLWEDVLKPIWEDFKKLLRNLFGNTWSEDMTKGWDEMWNEFGNIAGRVDQRVLQPIRNFFNRFRDNYFSPWKGDVEKLWDDIFGGAGFFKRKSDKADERILSPIRGFFTDFHDDYLSTWKSDVENLWDSIFGEDGFLKSVGDKVKVNILDPIEGFFTTFYEDTWPSVLTPVRALWATLFGDPDEGTRGFFMEAAWDFYGKFKKWLNDHLNVDHGPFYVFRVALQGIEGAIRGIIDALKEWVGRIWRPQYEDPGTPTVPSCFVKGTPILMINGNETSIEYVDIGDMVLSFDPEDGTFASGAVTSIVSRDTDFVYKITTEDDRVVKVTGEHPFYMPNSNKRSVHKDFVLAKDIEAGDDIFVENGNSLSKEKVLKVEQVFEMNTVYNFNVEEFHTYFANGIAVHNDKPNGMQHGGVVYRPTRTLIGEMGPEAIIPLRHGNVPVQMVNGAGGGITLEINITGNTFGSPDDAKKVADDVSREVLRKLRVRGVSTTGRF